MDPGFFCAENPGFVLGTPYKRGSSLGYSIPQVTATKQTKRSHKMTLFSLLKAIDICPNILVSASTHAPV